MSSSSHRSVWYRVAYVACVAGALGTFLAVSACTTNPATGQQDFTLFMSESEEARIGAQEHSKLIARYGGVYDDPEIGAYVAEIGGRLVANSERRRARFSFTVLVSLHLDYICYAWPFPQPEVQFLPD